MAVTVLSAPATNLLLVSHDFKHEYETELRRHMALWAPGPLTARPSRVLVLEKDGSVHQFFRRIPSLVIRMWYCRKFDSSSKFELPLDTPINLPTDNR